MSDEQICKDCGHVGPLTSFTPGSRWIELILWLLFLVPGLIYSVWRLSARRDACAKCGGTALVPLDSPIGRRLAADVGYTLPPPAPPRKPSPAAVNAGRALGRLFRRR